MPIPAAILFACAASFASLLGVGAAWAQVVQGEEHCVVNVRTSDVLNVRAKPSASSRVVMTLPFGRCGIVVTGPCQGAWCPAEDGHDAGWVHSRFISMVSPARYCVTGVQRNDKLNLRAYPAPSSRVLTRLAPDQCGIAFLPYSTGSWQKVRVDGYEGWANRQYLSGQ
jgi:SH3-like domain-containing protein